MEEEEKEEPCKSGRSSRGRGGRLSSRIRSARDNCSLARDPSVAFGDQ